MGQLILRWKNNHLPEEEIEIPVGFSIKTLDMLDDGIDQWLDVVQHGLSEKREDHEYYRKAMYRFPSYNDKLCFFVMHGDEAVATLTVICNYETKVGYIHMVACKTGYRGMGLGKILNKTALKTLKAEGMENAYLETDDWRLPALKGYLKSGFVPDTSTEDYMKRWEKIFAEFEK